MISEFIPWLTALGGAIAGVIGTIISLRKSRLDEHISIVEQYKSLLEVVSIEVRRLNTKLEHVETALGAAEKQLMELRQKIEELTVENRKLRRMLDNNTR